MLIYNKNDPETIQALFNSIAKPYDQTNAVLSFNLHKRWNKELVKKIRQHNSMHTFLDLCAGTGDIAFTYLNALSTPCQAYLVDFSKEMLALAKKKEVQSVHSIEYIEANIEILPFSDESIDCSTIAYGIRNVHNPQKCLQEVYRVLKKGGNFGLLELTRPQNLFLQMGHKFYLRNLLPIIGKWLTTNKHAYHYLQQSILSFIPPLILEDLVIKAGFTNVKLSSLTGGIATMITASKS